MILYLHVLKKYTWYIFLQQTSMRRRTLEVNTEVLEDQLHNLQKLNDVQQSSIATYLEELQAEQQRTSQLLGNVTTYISLYLNYNIMIVWANS